MSSPKLCSLSSLPKSPVLQRKKALNLPEDFESSDYDSEGVEFVRDEVHSRSNSPNHQSFENASFNSTSTLEISETRFRRTSYGAKCSIKADKESNRKSEQSNSNSNNLTFALVCITISFIIIYLLFGKSSVPANVEKIHCSEFKELTKRFTHQDIHLWKSLKIGIENVLNGNPAKPSVFLLAYNDIETTRNVMATILNATAHCMKTSNPIQLDGETFATEAMIKDYGEIIAKYRGQLEHEGILYVSDVNKTPAGAAQVFHTICDTITPLVERAVIFFTVYVEQNDQDMSHQRLMQLVEDQLESNWHKDNKINDNALKALIGRVTDQVFLLRSEF